MKDLVQKINKSVIGANHLFKTPFGDKPLIYADYTASGRSLSFIEDYIRHQVMPAYANTHTEFSYSGAQTTHFREQAREIIHNAVNGSDDDKVIFYGSGATSVVNKLIAILGIRLPKELSDQYLFDSQIPEIERPVVFVGPFEHHSNELPWRESIATVVPIPLDETGHIDQTLLEEALVKYEPRKVKIGSFSAGSNVTGILSDVPAISKLLKTYNAYSFWDYAACAPYVPINMNGETPIDAVFFSPHKYVGGPGTPGVLVLKKHLMKNSVPATVGGGTVAYVTPVDHKYIDDPEEREEGGTPGIIETIRAGMVVKLQQDVGLETIQNNEHRYIKRAIEFFETLPNVSVLGNTKADRISIFSLRFTHGERDLHHGFVTAVLSDLFGIQARGGCSCAGPYGHHLLNIDLDHSRRLEKEVSQGYAILKPGWVRLNFNYFISDAEFDYLLQAIKLVSEFGWRLLPLYEVDSNSGVWRYNGQRRVNNESLHTLDWQHHDDASANVTEVDYHSLLKSAEEILLAEHEQTAPVITLPESAEAMRWFCLPADINYSDTKEEAIDIPAKTKQEEAVTSHQYL